MRKSRDDQRQRIAGRRYREGEMKELATLLTLERPLISVDLETTGLFPNVDRICQIGVIKLYPNGEIKEWESLINPGIPIPGHVAEIHHINDESVRDAPRFAHIAEKLYYGFKECDLTGYNCRNFDVRFLVEEFRRCNITFKPGRIADSFHIFKYYNPRNLSAAVRQYLGRDHTEAHSALPDAKASMELLEALLRQHPDLPREVGALERRFQPDGNNLDSEGKFVWNREGEVVFNFGKMRGTKLKSCDKQYLSWLLQANFSNEIKTIVQDAILGKYPRR